MTMRTKNLLAAGAALSVLAFASEASADAPKYGDLPSGTIADPPAVAKKPAAIGARETVPGLYVARQKQNPRFSNGQSYVTVVADAENAKSIEKGEGFNRDDSPMCLTEAHQSFASDDDEDEDPTAMKPRQEKLAWDENGLNQTNFWTKTKDNPSGGIGAMHAEKVVEGANGAATLEGMDAWIDPATKGARLIGKSSLPLKQIGSALGGTKIFAAKTTHGGKPFVDFVILRSKNASEMTRSMGLFAFHHDGSSAQSSGCPHLRVSVPVQASGGDTAVVMVTSTLPDLPHESDDDADTTKSEKTKEVTPAPAAPPPPPPVNAKGVKKRVTKRPRMPFFPGGTGEAKEVERRTRDAQVSLSVSQTSRDKEPIISISYGWSSREQVQRTFEVPPAPPPPPEG
jgi:hypothetical protein